MKNIAVITARSGSKGLKDKNILPMNGKPLLSYTIKAALDSKCFDEVMVSTDSERYAEISREYGASVPFLRSAETSGDTGDHWDVIREVLTNYQKKGMSFDTVTLLQPTSPLRDGNDIIGAFKKLQEEGVNCVVSVTSVEHPVQLSMRLPDDCSMKEFANSPFYNARRQTLEPYYRLNGAIYIVDAKKIMDKDYNFYRDNCYAYVISSEHSVDIDDRLDFIIAEDIMKFLQEQ